MRSEWVSYSVFCYCKFTKYCYNETKLQLDDGRAYDYEHVKSQGEGIGFTGEERKREEKAGHFFGGGQKNGIRGAEGVDTESLCFRDVPFERGIRRCFGGIGA